MKRALALLMSSLACTTAMVAVAPPASAADFDYEEDFPELSLPGIDLAAPRTCSASIKTTITLQYRAATDTYFESITGTGKSSCSNERLSVGLTVSDESPLMPTYSKSTSTAALGTVSTNASQTVPARAVTQVTFRWNFVRQYGAPQCFQKTYLVVKGAAPRAGDTKPCGSALEAPPEEG